jgi:hypothetical protein
LLPLSFQLKRTRGFSSIIEALKFAGYKRGLTYQSMPYDFRKSYRSNRLNRIFKKNLKRMKNISGKKVVVLSHSLGGVNVQHQLSHLSQSEKDEFISFWIPMVPPFLGSMKSSRIQLSGMDDLYFSIFGFYLNASIKTTMSQPALYELLYRNPFKLYKNLPWFDWVQQRYILQLLFKIKDLITKRGDYLMKDLLLPYFPNS